MANGFLYFPNANGDPEIVSAGNPLPVTGGGGGSATVDLSALVGKFDEVLQDTEVLVQGMTALLADTDYLTNRIPDLVNGRIPVDAAVFWQTAEW